MPEFTLIVPFYRNVEMLKKQEKEWELYDPEVQVIVVDDCSPEPAADILSKDCRAEVYRITTDIPWNRNGARNLGAHVADNHWILQTDIDHILPAPGACDLRMKDLDPAQWYRFARMRVGRADETRKKDSIPEDALFGKIRPHVDSYLCRRDLYWSVGGYDEDYSGSLGGSSPFLSLMARAAACKVLEDIQLFVITRSVVKDASDFSLSRDRSRYERIKREKGIVQGENPLRFQWERVR